MAQIWSFPLFPDRAANTADRIDMVFYGFLIFSLILTAFIGILILWYCVKYRAASRVDRSHAVPHLTRYEIIWIGSLTLISLVMFAWSGAVFFDVSIPPASAR